MCNDEESEEESHAKQTSPRLRRPRTQRDRGFILVSVFCRIRPSAFEASVVGPGQPLSRFFLCAFASLADVALAKSAWRAFFLSVRFFCNRPLFSANRHASLVLTLCG
jgi:hypothetical protein